MGNLNTARGFASVVSVEVEFNNTKMYILGGYLNGTGFLKTVEKYDKATGEFALTTWEMPEAKSHFCTLLVEVILARPLSYFNWAFKSGRFRKKFKGANRC